MKKSIWAIGGGIIIIGIVGISLYKIKTTEDSLTAQTSQPTTQPWCTDTDNGRFPATSGAGIQWEIPVPYTKEDFFRNYIPTSLAMNSSGTGGRVKMLNPAPGGPTTLGVNFTIKNDRASLGFFNWLLDILEPGTIITGSGFLHDENVAPQGKGKCFYNRITFPSVTYGVPWKYSLNTYTGTYLGNPSAPDIIRGSAAIAP